MTNTLRNFLRLVPLALTMLPAGAQPFRSFLVSNLLSNVAGPFTPQMTGTIKFADVDGDRFPDLCYLQSDGLYCALYQPGAKMFALSTRFTEAITLGNTGLDSMWQTLQYGDLNRDGYDDVCVRQLGGMVCLRGSPTKFESFIPGDAKANAFSDAQLFGTDPSYWRTIRLADVTGDGLLDVCGRGKEGILCQPLTKDSDHGPFYFGAGFNKWQRQFSDDNGWKTSESNWGTIQFPDLNADGKADVCGRAGSGVVCYLSNGTTFGATSTSILTESFFSDANYWNQKKYFSTIQFADIDGDHRPDLCGRGVAGVFCALTRVMRGGFLHISNAVLAETFYSDANRWDIENRFATIRLTDVDGDGKADVCGRYSDYLRCSLSQTTLLTAPQFGASQVWVDNFGDIYNWNLSESNWRTVQPVRATTTSVTRPVIFCGRGDAGIWCSDYR